MPTQNINLGSTSNVLFNGNRVDFLYLDSALIWSRVSVTLSLLDAFGPEIQVSASNLSSGDKWQYKVDSGSWQTGGNFPTTGSNTVSKNLNLNTGGTKNIQARVLNSANIVLATSNTIQVTLQQLPIPIQQPTGQPLLLPDYINKSLNLPVGSTNWTATALQLCPGSGQVGEPNWVFEATEAIRKIKNLNPHTLGVDEYVKNGFPAVQFYVDDYLVNEPSGPYLIQWCMSGMNLELGRHWYGVRVVYEGKTIDIPITKYYDDPPEVSDFWRFYGYTKVLKYEEPDYLRFTVGESDFANRVGQYRKTVLYPTKTTTMGSSTETYPSNFDLFTVSPSLPNGITLHPTTGAISGTPTAPSPPTIHTITATEAAWRNSQGGEGYRERMEITIEVVNP